MCSCRHPGCVSQQMARLGENLASASKDIYTSFVKVTVWGLRCCCQNIQCQEATAGGAGRGSHSLTVRPFPADLVAESVIYVRLLQNVPLHSGPCGSPGKSPLPAPPHQTAAVLIKHRLRFALNLQAGPNPKGAIWWTSRHWTCVLHRRPVRSIASWLPPRN